MVLLSGMLRLNHEFTYNYVKLPVNNYYYIRRTFLKNIKNRFTINTTSGYYLNELLQVYKKHVNDGKLQETTDVTPGSYDESS